MQYPIKDVQATDVRIRIRIRILPSSSKSSKKKSFFGDFFMTFYLYEEWCKCTTFKKSKYFVLSVLKVIVEKSRIRIR